MTSPIFDTLTAEREATPVFESLTRRRDDPRWAFDTAHPSPTPAPSPTSTRNAVTAVATWPLRAVPC